MTILKSPFKTTGLQDIFRLHNTEELDVFLPITLYSTGNTTEEQVREVLESIPEVLEVRELSMKKVKWSAVHHEEYMVDFPDDLYYDHSKKALMRFTSSVPEFSDERSTPAGGFDHEFDFENDDCFPTPFSAAFPIEDNIDDFAEPPPPSKEKVLRDKRNRNAKAVWEHHQTDGYQRDISRRPRKPIDPKTQK